MTDNNKNKNNNKSMFVYTALIFFVAVILIILSFFGQTNMKKNQPKIDDVQQGSSITERASVLSEENTALITENKNLLSQIDELEKINSVNELLLSANGYLSVENIQAAEQILEDINYDELSADQKILYNEIKNNLKQKG